jgi:nicotinate-nucleotide adenylyltransferase
LARTHPPDFVVFGGSFNPLHTGHVEIVRQLAGLPGVAQVLVIPAGQSPFKPGAPLLPADLRYRMICAATAGMARVAVLDCELRRLPPSYTVDTLAELRQVYPEARLWLALGMDVYSTFAAWHQAAALLEIAGLLVFAREGAGAERQGREATLLPPPWQDRVRADADGQLVDPTGRCVVRWAPIRVPAVAASAIVRERDLNQVPPPARAMLAAHWQQHPPAGQD